MANSLESIGRKIRIRRRHANLTQQALAERAGISYKYLGEIERGQGNLSVEILLKIVSALGIAAGDILDTAEPKKPQTAQQIQTLCSKMSPEQVLLALALLETLLQHPLPHSR
ncbi:helix-turn-helix domain-containing protein [Oleidesulfovibrio sp.]|uniref:helix-turn-helix domain-containing protein n=1 Tax=Oleidesulfovibrio sp. TaxID=2909707 RepID=UPI003A872DBD